VTLANPAALGLLALAIPIVLLHVLRPRREQRTVPSTFLWEAVARPVSAARPWQRLRPSWLLFLQLLAVALLAVAVADPVRIVEAPLAEHTVFIVDASASMAATDGEPTRLDEARAEAMRLRRELPDAGLASIIVADGNPRSLLTASPDPTEFDRVLATIEPSAGGADWAQAFDEAVQLDTLGAEIGFHLLTDGGGLAGTVLERLIPEGSRHTIVGERSTNRAVTALVVEQRGSQLHATATVRNTGGGEATDGLRFRVDGVVAETVQVQTGPGATETVEVDLPVGDRVEAFLQGDDLLDVDDRAFATAARRRAVTVLLCAPTERGNPFLQGALEASEGVTVESCTGPNPGTGADLVIYDRVPVPADVAAPFLAVAPPEGVPAAGITAAGPVETLAVTTVTNGDSLVDGLDLAEVSVATAERWETGTNTVVVASNDVPLLVRGTTGGLPFAALSFSVLPENTNLPLLVAFPLLVDRVVTELAAAAVPPSGVLVDDALPVERQLGGTVTAPGGTELEVVPGAPAPVADRPGFWVIEAPDRPERVVAVNVDPQESELEPASALLTATRTRQEGEPVATGQESMRHWLIAPLLAVLAVEWWLSRRRRGVGRGQWRAATAVRVGIAALLIAALLGPVLVRPADRVATVFLLDGSASLGAAGRAEASAFVRESLGDMPAGAVAGVVSFGGDADPELVVQPDPIFDQASTSIDANRTNLASALRVGAGMLPADARRRLVIVSDGRANSGDADAEVERLRERGIEVEYRVVGRQAEADLAVASVDVPNGVRAGEEFDLEVTVDADQAGPAQLTTLLDGEVVDERVVDLPAGRTVVQIPQVAGPSGLGRYQVQVSGTGNAVVENDVGYAAVQVLGAASVLVVEGISGSGAVLAAALEASGLAVEITPAESLPSLDRLAAHQAVVLVDVQARQLSPDQVAALAASTRDLGHGLLTIGGPRSYGLGGYLGTPLEELLPVISEITDPQRRQSVAEVLAIDSSGSMGECHCAEGQGQASRLPGGVEKTDIARAAAARAIEALSDIDEVGVLAFNTQHEWLIDLQQLPSDEVIREGLDAIRPAGGTDLRISLSTAAEQLRASSAALKHIILFTDGFTAEAVFDELADEAAALFTDEGITVSVIATGEGAADQLEAIAEAGGGRFYPGRDLQEIPQLMMEEAVLASRDFVNEGEFFPEVTSGAEVVEDLTESPPLLGYVATTARPLASTLLRIGPDRDPLLTTWQVGLGRSTAWASDASDRWSQEWASWEGYADFWGDVVRDTFPSGTSGTASVVARVQDGVLRLTVESADAFPDGASIVVRVTDPELNPVDVVLTRTGPGEFAGEVPVDVAGTYAIGAQVLAADGTPTDTANALATLSYAPEFEPGDPDEAALARLAEATGGRGAIEAAQAFDEADLRAGRARTDLAPWLVLAACLLFPLAVALSRLNLRGSSVTSSVAHAGSVAWWRVRTLIPARPGREDDAPEAPKPPKPPKPERAPKAADPEVAIPSSLGTLLDRKRGTPPSDPPPD
jgi:Mg-chelatase subunit ChlD